MPCVLIYDVPAASTLYLTVEGVRVDDVGVFEASVLCHSLEAAPLEESCDRQHITVSKTGDDGKHTTSPTHQLP